MKSFGYPRIVLWFWSFATRPLLKVAAPRVIVEVGAQAGKSTVNLLALAEEIDAVVHVVDTVRAFDVEDYGRRFPGRMIFHEGMSLDVIPTITNADVFLIDGDHNWYTVYHELKAIEAVASNEARPFPLTLFHDVEWPYARRDMYYDPSNIPEEFRQPAKKGCVYPGKPGLQPKGLNRHLHHALVEGTARNGVLTAIEDFMSESSTDLVFQTITGSSGLGMLAQRSTLESHPALRREWGRFRSAEFLAEHCERVEAARRQLRVDYLVLRRDQTGLTKERDRVQAELAEAQAELAQLRATAGAA